MEKNYGGTILPRKFSGYISFTTWIMDLKVKKQSKPSQSIYDSISIVST
jgi:hypothetical protein